MYDISDCTSLHINFLEVREPFTCPPTASISVNTLNHAFSAFVSGLTCSPFIIQLVDSSNTNLSSVINHLAILAK